MVLERFLAITVSFVNILGITPLIVYIIWYEKYGTNYNRTLINQGPIL
jgi:hypothetical protein